MVFVIVDTEKAAATLLVKADNFKEVEKRLNLTESQTMMGAFTDIEIQTLETSKFAVISA